MAVAIGNEVAWWYPSKQVTKSGPTLTDQIGNLDITMTDHVWTADSSLNGTYAITCNGTSTELNAGDDNVFSFAAGSNDLPCSFSCFVNYSSHGANTGCLFGKSRNSVNLDFEYDIHNEDTGELRVTFRAALSGGNFIRLTTDNAISTGQWHHVLVTYDGSGTPAGITIYIDGIVAAATTSTGGTYARMSNSAEPLLVGAAFTTQSFKRYLDGMVDDIRVFDIEITNAADIATLASTRSPTALGGPRSGPLTHPLSGPLR